MSSSPPSTLPARPRLPRAVLAVVMSVLALLAAGARLAPAASASVAPAGFYTSTPSFGSTSSGNDFSVNAELSLANDDDGTVSWGDGTSDDADTVCHHPDGSQGDRASCFVDLGPAGAPTGTLWETDSHSYTIAGTYHPKLTYKAFGISYSASWTVVAPGLPPVDVPLQLSYDSSAMSVSLSPAPDSVMGRAWVPFWAVNAETYYYPPNTQVTVQARPDANVTVDGWTHVYCGGGCRYEDGDTYDHPLCGATTSCQLTTIPGLSADDEGSGNGVRVVTIATTLHPAAQTVAFPTPGSLLVHGSASLRATASSGQPVTYTTGTPAVCQVTGSLVFSDSPGVCTVTATQAGSATLAAASRTVSFPVTYGVTSTESVNGVIPAHSSVTVFSVEVSTATRSLVDAGTATVVPASALPGGVTASARFAPVGPGAGVYLVTATWGPSSVIGLTTTSATLVVRLPGDPVQHVFRLVR